MKHIAILSLVALLFCACGKTPTDGASEEAAGSLVVKKPAGTKAAHRTNEGDVEQTVGIEAQLHPDSASDSITLQESRDALERQRLLTVDVSPPFPDHLWLTYTIKCREVFADRPVALRFRIVAQTGRGEQRAEREVGTFAAVLDANARNNGFEGKVDVLEGAESVPETMLVKVLAEAHLMPDGTDETTVDPRTATGEGPADTTTALPYLAPVRVNFLAKEPAAE